MGRDEGCTMGDAMKSKIRRSQSRLYKGCTVLGTKVFVINVCARRDADLSRLKTMAFGIRRFIASRNNYNSKNSSLKFTK